jgi:NAD(P)-dependent dehydrogenase (short-subunit alcohol dehydrogenase family)
MTTYGAETTTDEVLDGIDLSGRRIVITGASGGLGEEATRALAAHGATVTMLARSPEKNAAAAERIKATVPDADLRAATVDLSSFASIRTCADTLNEQGEAIDVLMNNAGVMACPESFTVDGFETQFGTNHLGHFLLTSLLMDRVLEGDQPRVVTLTSAGHTISDVELDDISFKRGDYDPWIAYGRAKSANALFALGLADRFSDRLLSFSVHPGAIVTNLGRHLTDELIAEMMERTETRGAGTEGDKPPTPFAFKKVEAGAATQVWGSVAPDLEPHNGSYLANCHVGVEGGDPNDTGYFSHITDHATSDRLWAISEEITAAG